MKTITRRTALAVPVTLPLLPVSAYAKPADPAVEAYRAWRAAFVAYERSWDRPHVPDDDPIMNAACEAEWQAKGVCANLIPATPEGLAGQLRMGLGVFGDLFLASADPNNPADYLFDNCRDDLDGRLYRNILAGAERMAGVPSWPAHPLA